MYTSLDRLEDKGLLRWQLSAGTPSRDGLPFVMHDATVDRTTDGTGAIRSLTAARLKALDAGSWFAPQYAGVRIPTLGEQLADLRTRGGNLLLEIKGAHTRAEVAKMWSTWDAFVDTGKKFQAQSPDKKVRFIDSATNTYNSILMQTAGQGAGYTYFDREGGYVAAENPAAAATKSA